MKLATCIVGGVVSQSPSTVFWVQTQYVIIFSVLKTSYSVGFQHLGLLCTSFRNVNQPRCTLLEAPQPPVELCLIINFHGHGSIHAWDRGCILRQHHCHAGTVSFRLLHASSALTPCSRLITLGVFIGLTLFTFQSKVCAKFLSQFLTLILSLVRLLGNGSFPIWCFDCSVHDRASWYLHTF